MEKHGLNIDLAAKNKDMRIAKSFWDALETS